MGTQGQGTDIVFLSGRRTPFGTFGGTLKDFSATQLGAEAARSAIEESHVDTADIGHVVFGNALQTSADAIYLARHVGLQAGLANEVPALTVNRLCGSGFQAIVSAAQEIILGQADVCLAGGTESMSQAPHVVRGARWGSLRLGEAGGFFEDLLWQALTDTQCGMSMAQTAEELAGRYEIEREAVDRIALRVAAASQTRVGGRAVRRRGDPHDHPDEEGGAGVPEGRAHPVGHDHGSARGSPSILQEGRARDGGERQRDR